MSKFTWSLSLYFLLTFAVSNTSWAQCSLGLSVKPNEDDAQFYYPIELLEATLAITEDVYPACKVVKHSALSEKRRVQALIQESEVDIIWLPARTQVSEQILPIKKPIRLGLLGWRVLVVNKQNKDDINLATSISELNRYRAGFGKHWSDLPVMLKNFDNVIVHTNLDALYYMLEYQRFDFFSRAIFEVKNEMSALDPSLINLSDADQLLLHYPNYSYFFVKANNPALAERIEMGLARLNKNGEWRRLFARYYAPVLKQMGFNKRRLIELSAPEPQKRHPEYEASYQELMAMAK